MTHANAAELEAIRLEYRASLADLTFNSKPIITNLTIIAQENTPAAPAIVQAIEDQMRNAQPKQKLPVLYLMDSIIKNVGGIYINLFARNIVRIFVSAYEMVDADDKQRFFKVLSTWKSQPTGPIFSNNIMAGIESAMRKAAGQPRRRPSLGQIHVNPNFVARGQSFSPQSTTASPNVLTMPTNQPNSQDRSATRRYGANTPYDRPQGGRGRPESGPQRRGNRAEGRLDTRRHPSPIQDARLSDKGSYAQGPSTLAFGNGRSSGLSPAIPSVTTATPISQPSMALDVVSLQQQIQSLLAQKEALAILNPLDTSNAGHIQVLTQLLGAMQNTALDAASIQQIAQMLQQYALASVPAVPLPQPVAPPAQLPPILSTILPSQPLPLPNASMGFGMSAAPFLQRKYSTPGSGLVTPHAVAGNLSGGVQGLLANASALDGLLDTLKWASGSSKTGTMIGNLPFGSGIAVPSAVAQDDGAVIGGGEHGGGRVRTVKDLPIIRLVNEDINKTYPNAVELLYEALDLQCRQCGTRYMRNDTGRGKMDAHLDWHFRQNRRAKEKAKKAISRDWFVSEEDWIKEQEVDIKDRKAPTLFFENDKTVEEAVEEVSNIPAEGETNPRCTVCQEPLEKFYDEEMDDWMLRASVRVDGKLYHQACYQDAQKDGIPSTNGTQVISPSTGKRKREDQEETLAREGKSNSPPQIIAIPTPPHLMAASQPLIPIGSVALGEGLTGLVSGVSAASLLSSLGAGSMVGNANVSEDVVKRLKLSG
ncbi:uncharacterized protein SPPG_01555 [Spizellomyces punctatus DAOM BR117]|uniref:CID domain-containing protein n=1 Tax=Spizellomyces punctatus (strain DAOM BR117) TaxID=645134 RepID=A0A0L0HRY4_SPIPD|nr:uncharacterized protein SPPG_01555 [Spizellomyces punctatus DAOM BR117]KND04116.1 hypothetical protein SPPG_01555 [Spizellomyces punctatus DAOM BR117]|eukprot:XP_016612155.1 hypothetical protein SPPG_01555 [Spizellomyces punctatus DAOM BR117]